MQSLNDSVRRLMIVALSVVASLAVAVEPTRAQDAMLGPAAVDSQTVVLTPTRDTFIDSLKPDAAYEDQPDLLVDRTAPGSVVGQKQTLLRFDLAGIPQNAVILSAQLELYQTTGSTNPILLNRIVTDWPAAPVTWNSRPGSVTYDAFTPPSATGQSITRDITALVNSWVNTPANSPNFGLLLASGATGGDARAFHSVDRVDGKPPILRINFALPPIRVCYDEALECAKPVSGAEVFDRTTGKVYSTDSAGQVMDSSGIQLGDSLWARVAVSSDQQETRYRTSGAPETVDVGDFHWTRNEMRLVMPSNRQLMVRDLNISAQWNLDGDDAFKDWLAAAIVHASHYFYDYSDGQFILGRVIVYPSYQSWDASDAWLHTSNTFRPLSYIKGEVPVVTLDPGGAGIEYDPGHIYLGSYWNRYGLPPGQPAPAGVDVSNDFARALSHELGHYLLGQFDAYLAVNEQGIVVETYACTGSAMGWVYENENHGFVFDQDHWLQSCANTLGNLNLKRNEWDTVATWYPWVVKPIASVPGPDAPPVELTTVTFVPSSAPAPLPNQVFNLGYQDEETASGEARAFLIRDGTRILDEGRPPQGATPPQVTLTGAQPSDRLCVIDIDDHAIAPETPRHQYGCEFIEAGDNDLLMEKDSAWAPVIEINPLTTTTVGISVTQDLAGATLQAQLYPEHSGTPSPIVTLTEAGPTWQSVFTVPGMTPAAFVQVWVDEPSSEVNPRREAIIDYGIGGGAVPGPKHNIGFAPMVSSSDGRAFFLLPPGLTLLADQFIAIQTGAASFPLPPGSDIIGQSYRLISLPPSLVANGSINLYATNIFGGLAAAAAGDLPDSLALYFWTGDSWRRLDTTITNSPDGQLLASAPSQGVGAYALLYEPAANGTIYLPLLGR